MSRLNKYQYIIDRLELESLPFDTGEDAARVIQDLCEEIDQKNILIKKAISTKVTQGGMVLINQHAYRELLKEIK